MAANSKELPSWSQIVKFTISFLTVTCGYRALTGTHWNKIIDGLYLGALPIKTELGSHGGHHKKLIQQCKNDNSPLGLVVSVVQDFEKEGHYLPVDTVSSKDWEQENIRRIQIKVQDFTADVTPDEIARAMWELHLTRQQGLSVYVHCKAGVARSWMIVMCYLSTYCGYSIQDAMKLTQLQRPQVSPCAAKLNKINNFVWMYNDKIKKSHSAPDLASLETAAAELPKSNSTNAMDEILIPVDILALDDFEEFMENDSASKTKQPPDTKP